MALLPGLQGLSTAVPPLQLPVEADTAVSAPVLAWSLPPGTLLFLSQCFLLYISAPFLCSKFSVKFSFSSLFFSFFLFYKLICFQFHLVDACVLTCGC